MSKEPARSSGRAQRPKHAGGFSMVELLVVVAIVIGLTAISLPTLTTLAATTKMRGAMGNLSGLYQNARSMAVKQNKITRVRFQFSNNRWVVFVDNGTSPTGLTTATPQIYLPAQMSKVSPPSGGAGAPTALNDTICGASTSSTLDTTDDTYFNQMGLPCLYSAGACSAGGPFAYYFNYAGTLGGASWSAVCVSPAGRLKAWYWTGSSWTN